MIDEILSDLFYGGLILIFPIFAIIMQKIENKRQ